MMSERKWLEAKPGRLAALACLPVFFSLQGKRAVIAGGSAAAAWKAELLSAAGAEAVVYAVEVCTAIKALAADPPNGRVTINRRAWTASDLPGAAVVIGDFDDKRGAAAFCDAARALGVPVNVIDRPEFCDFSFGAIVNRSPLVVGISTGGAAPVFAQAIRSKLEALLPRGFAGWTAAAARWRKAVSRAGLSRAGRRRFWQLFAARALAGRTGPPGRDDFDRLMAAAAVDARGCGSVVFVNVDPDNPDLLTLGDARALQAADVIIFDDRVPSEALDFARREARKIAIGHAGDDRLGSRHDIGVLSADLVRQGERVVVLAPLRRTDRADERLSSAA